MPAARGSPELFEILSVRPQLGRLLRTDEDQPGRDGVVVISDQLWRRRYNDDRTIVGRTISVNGTLHELRTMDLVVAESVSERRFLTRWCCSSR